MAERSEASSAPSTPRAGRRRTVSKAAAAIAALLVAAFALCEWWGWPFLAGPIQRALATALDRPVTLAARGAAATDPGGAPASASDDVTRVRFIGGLTLQTPRLEIGAPAWSQAPHMLVAERATLVLRYIDLWRARDGAPLRVKRLQAERLDLIVERLADGRASWQFAAKKREAPEESKDAAVPVFDRLQVDEASFRYVDQSLNADLKGRFSLREGASATVQQPGSPPDGLRVEAEGSYKAHPVKAQLRSVGILPWVADDASARPLPLMIDLHAGPSRFRFDGTATDLVNLAGLGGKVLLSGPSLAAVGDVIGVTLPTTHPFRLAGVLQKERQVWSVRVDDATVGASRLNAALRYDSGLAVPLLAGRVGGPKLLLSDLGPTIGGETRAAPQTAAAPAKKSDRVLPDRAFDLPSLRAMDANVLLDFGELDLDTDRAQPLRPLRAHLKLRSGVLQISDIDARTADGRLRGMVSLDGTGARAIWRTDLGWDGIRLDRWLRQPREGGAPPYVSGEVTGIAKLEGRGRSTAEILGDLNGQFRTELRSATVSHLVIEAAGLDIAEGLGILFRGDESLRVQCGLADLQAEKGVLRPRAFVLDTKDSVLWVDGSVSMVDETLDLRAVVTPKDFSPMTLRTPLHVRGTLGSPKVSLDAKPLVPKLGASALLALLHPLAALLPLFDTGGQKDRGDEGCAQLVRRAADAAVKLPGTAPRSTPR